MKLLLDANLSPRLKRTLEDVFPHSSHVFECGGIADDDLLIWEYARTNGNIILIKDGDFQGLSLAHGAPPKVIWLRIGNAGTTEIERVLRARLIDVQDFEGDPLATLLVID